jgi:gluconolactonase
MHAGGESAMGAGGMDAPASGGATAAEAGSSSGGGGAPSGGARGLAGEPSASQGGRAGGSAGESNVPANAGATGGSEPTGTGGATSGGGSGGGGGRLGPYTCPASTFAMAPFPGGATAERIAGVPPEDDFILSDEDVVIIEGPVWLDGSLYVSEIENGSPFGRPGGPLGGAPGSGGASGAEAPPARILKITEAGEVSVALADVGTNGLAVDDSGNLVGCSHKTGSVSRLSLEGIAPVDLVTMYMGSRFDSPNDLTFGADGTLYFTDPDHQAPSPAPQDANRAYRVAPGTTTAVPIADGLEQPNGITLSPDRQVLYISNPSGVFSHPVLPDGNVGGGVRFGGDAVRSSDGMAVDCAGNLYTTSGQNVIVLGPAGDEVARLSVSGVQQVTNVAFGGTDRKTLYITALGSGGRSGLFRIASEIPGMPY